MPKTNEYTRYCITPEGAEYMDSLWRDEIEGIDDGEMEFDTIEQMFNEEEWNDDAYDFWKETQGDE